MSKNKNKNKRKRKTGGGGGPSAQDPAEAIESLRALREVLEGPDAGPNWGAAHKLLVKAGVPVGDITPVIIGRDLAAYDRLVAGLAGEPSEVDALPTEEPAVNDEATSDAIPAETLKKAMKAFRRRVKLTRLDQESKLGVGPMSSGRTAEFESIIPPHEFPAQVWRALAAEGRLVDTGRGFYKLPGN